VAALALGCACGKASVQGILPGVTCMWWLACEDIHAVESHGVCFGAKLEAIAVLVRRSLFNMLFFL
jgi:hypothetical protein